MDLAPPRGTRDFFPADMRLRNWLFGHFREVSRIFGFEEYDAPIVESEELYTRKAGEEIVHLLPSLESKVDDVVFPFDSTLREAAMKVAERLRRGGRSVDLILEDKKVK